MNMRSTVAKLTLATLAFCCLLLGQWAVAADNIKGQVLGGGAPIAKSTVSLWEASAEAPKKLGETKTNAEGRFEIRAKGARNDAIFYLEANGGVPKAGQGSGDN